MSQRIPIGLHDAERRSRRAWFEDGVPELVGGISILAIGAVNFALAAPPLAPFLVLVLVSVGGPQVTTWLKRRISDPRTGYVRPWGQTLDARGWLLAVVAGVAVAAVFFWVALAAVMTRAADPNRERFDLWQDAWFGPVVFLSGILAFTAWRFGLLRYALMAVIPWIVAAVTLPAGLTQRPALGLLIGTLGAALLASGAITFTRYLRRHPLDPDAGNPPDLRPSTREGIRG